MNLVIRILVGSIAVFVTSYVLPGVTVDGFVPAVVTAVVLGILNAILKPILVLLTLPINILTLGLFTLVINTFIVLLVSSLVTGFAVAGFLWAFLFSVVLALVMGFLSKLA